MVGRWHGIKGLMEGCLMTRLKHRASRHHTPVLGGSRGGHVGRGSDGVFLRGSHEMKTPLWGMLWGVKVLERRSIGGVVEDVVLPVSLWSMHDHRRPDVVVAVAVAVVGVAVMFVSVGSSKLVVLWRSVRVKGGRNGIGGGQVR